MPRIAAALDVKGQRGAVRLFNHQFAHRQQPVDRIGNIGARRAIGAFQNPDRLDAFEQMCDLAVDHFLAATGSPWLPRTGSHASHRDLTSAVLYSRAYLSAKRRKETEVHCPEGMRIVFSGGDYQADDLIWSDLDATLAQYPDMVLVHGGTPKGAKMIAARWADTRGVTQAVFKLDWKSHGKAAPFKRNDTMREIMPQGLIATPGSGITENIVDKARKPGIRIKRIGA